MASRLAHALLALYLAFSISGCTSRVSPDAPKGGASPVPTELAQSVIVVPVSVSLEPIRVLIDAELPKEDIKSGAFTPVEGGGVKYEIRRQDVWLNTDGASLTAGTTLLYKLLFATRVEKPFPLSGFVWVTLGSCGFDESDREARVSLTTKLSWTPEWRLSTSTSANAIDFPNKCEVTLANINVTSVVDDFISTKLRDAAGKIDGRLAEHTDLKDEAAKAWQRAWSSIAITDEVKLFLKPNSVGVGPITGSGSTLQMTAFIIATPLISIGNESVQSPPELPGLELMEKEPGFHIAVEGELAYSEATRLLKDQIVGRQYPIGNHELKIDDARVYGTGDVCVVDLQVSGDVSGTLYFVGKPRYDAETEKVVVDEFDYSVETKSVLAKIADWLMHEGFRDSLAAEAQWPLGTSLSDARQRFESAINQSLDGGIVLSGSVDSHNLEGVFITPTAFRARAVVTGKLSMSIEHGQ